MLCRRPSGGSVPPLGMSVGRHSYWEAAAGSKVGSSRLFTEVGRGVLPAPQHSSIPPRKVIEPGGRRAHPGVNCMRAGCCLFTLALLVGLSAEAGPPADPPASPTNRAHWAFQPIRSV